MATIHPTALVDPRAELADDAEIGAYSIIKGGVTIGSGTIVYEHTHIHGQAIIGKDCRLGPAAYIGMAPQHLRYSGEPTYLVIGDGVIVRETATLHRSTSPGLEHATRIGARAYIMVNAHVGHDCVLEENVILANGVLLGGHVTIGANAFLGGGCCLHQFVRCGRLAIIGGNAAITQDVPPFAAVHPGGRLKGYNAIGCKRAGLSREQIAAVRAAFYCLHTHRGLPAAIAAIRAGIPDVPEVHELVDFIASTRRGIVTSWRHRNSRPEHEDL